MWHASKAIPVQTASQDQGNVNTTMLHSGMIPQAEQQKSPRLQSQELTYEEGRHYTQTW